MIPDIIHAMPNAVAIEGFMVIRGLKPCSSLLRSEFQIRSNNALNHAAILLRKTIKATPSTIKNVPGTSRCGPPIINQASLPNVRPLGRRVSDVPSRPWFAFPSVIMTVHQYADNGHVCQKRNGTHGSF